MLNLILSMDIVIPLGRGSRNSDMELRYCLRGIEMYACDVENVFIIGERPSFLSNVIHIHAVDMDGHEYKERNIYSKIMLACSDKRVSDDFLFFNDDHFLLAPFDPSTYHYKESLRETQMNRKVKDAYYLAICNTLGYIGDGKNFDVHCPIVYNKERFKRTVGTASWYQKGGFLIKSLYCNMNGIVGSYFQDLKITKPFSRWDLNILIRKRPYFSVGDHGINDNLKQLLKDLYPNPSRYES